MTIQKKSLISTLNTTKKAIVASGSTGSRPRRPRLRALQSVISPTVILPTVMLAKRDAANRDFAKRDCAKRDLPNVYLAKRDSPTGKSATYRF